MSDTFGIYDTKSAPKRAYIFVVTLDTKAVEKLRKEWEQAGYDNITDVTLNIDGEKYTMTMDEFIERVTK